MIFSSVVLVAPSQKNLSVFGVLYIQVVPGQAGGGSFRRKKYILQRKNLPIECAQTIPLLCRSFLLFHGGDVLRFEVKCFDVLMSVAGSGDVVVTSFDAMSRDAMQCHGDELLYVSSTAAGWNVISFARPPPISKHLSTPNTQPFCFWGFSWSFKSLNRRHVFHPT